MARNRYAWLGLMLSIVWLLTGCQAFVRPQPEARMNLQSTRNNCCSLLYQLFEEDKGVSFLRFIKPENFALRHLTEAIAANAKAGAKQLEELAKEDPTLSLDDLRLPSGEVDTRLVISKTKAKQLLSQNGNKFELTLLMSEAEAMNYGWHLALIAAKNETRPDRVLILTDMANKLENLYWQDYDILLSNTKPAASD